MMLLAKRAPPMTDQIDRKAVEAVVERHLEEMHEIRDDDSASYEASFRDKASAAIASLEGLAVEIRALPTIAGDASSPAPSPTAAEREVLEKAEALRQTYREVMNRDDLVVVPKAMWEPLVEAVRALRDSRPPQAVKPSEVEPGSLFRFAHDPNGPVLRLLAEEGGPLMFTAAEGEAMLHRFCADDMIIPLPDQD